MRVVFHIGAAKAGSSAIQTALAANVDTLRRGGWLIPGSDLAPDTAVSGQHVFAFQQLSRLPVDTAKQQFEAVMNQLREAADRAACPTVLFSAENLSNPKEWAPILVDALAGDQVDVVLYVRRQDEFLLSAWQQWGLKLGIDFDEWLLRHLGTMANWKTPIVQWRRVSPNLTVRVYDRQALAGGDVIEDFFGVVGLDEFPLDRPGEVNPSFSLAAEELMLDAHRLFEDSHDNRVAKFIERTGRGGQIKDPAQSRLTARERQLILNHYAEANRWVRDSCFPTDVDLPPALFAVTAEDRNRTTPSRDEIIDQKFALLFELLYASQLDDD